ncbi:T9SS type A sorting domain-containing protein [Flavobacterium sp. Arc3]|uniref:LamG-like jellyroll fold domain-containing protein n=1 Tax=Flavobacterium sp. Arc3 TaxID=3046686 RepID=UPI00352D5D70
MEKNTSKKLLLAIMFFCSIVSYTQTFNVSYGLPAIIVVNGGTVNFGSSGEIEFSIENTTVGNNGNLNVQSISSNNSNLIVLYTYPKKPYFISDDKFKRGDSGEFKIKRNSYNCGTGSSVITVKTNSTIDFTFTVTFDNKPSISVLGGALTQSITNGQTVPTSATGTLFGTIDVFATTDRTFYIANTGTCPLSRGIVTSLITASSFTTTSGPSSDFLIITQPITNILNRGATTNFIIRFTPQSPGTKWAQITIPSNDPLKLSYTFTIKGEGYDSTINGPGGGNPNFRLWLKANRGINLTTGMKVPIWKDLGSLGKDATQVSAAHQPTYIDDSNGNINYNSVVKFENNGSTVSQFLINTDNGYYTQETFIVMEPDVTINSATAGMTIISGTSAANPFYPIVSGEHTGIGFGDFSTRLTNEKLWINQWQETITAPYYSVGDEFGNYSIGGIINARNRTAAAIDGIELLFNTNEILAPLTSLSSGYSNLGYLDGSIYKGTPYNIGKNINSGTDYGNLNGRVAEVISYASRVPDTNRPKIETYLAIKYGITLGINGASKNYINSAGNVIWDIALNAGFNYNIAGIGRDVASDLYQKQSKSSNNSYEVTIGLGEIAMTNSANINEFRSDYDFLVWGSDNGSYNAGSINTTLLRTGLTTTVTKIRKKWKVVETAGDIENIFIGIPEAAFGSFSKLATEEYGLIVSDDSNFSDSDIIDVIPLRSDGKGNLQTWYDFDGTKYFTFGKIPKVTSKELANLGGGDYFVGEYALNLNSGSFTIGCWLRNDGTVNANKTIMSKGVNLEMRLNSANKIEGLWDGILRFVSNTAVADGKWHNIVAVYYLGSADIYIDGVLDSSTFNIQNPSPNYSRYSLGALYVNKGDVRTPFYGEIDEIHIWDMALTSGQINYLMNQEIEKYGLDNTTNGRVLPRNISNNEVKTIPWSTLKAYYDFNTFYGTTVEGLTNDRNFLRIKYLDKDKNSTAVQTAPLPYETVADGEWNGTNSLMWKNGDIQTIPNAVSIVNSGLTVNGNIVKIKHNVGSVGNKTVLGLFVEGTDASTSKTLSAKNNTKIEISHYLKLDGLIDLHGRSQLIQTLNSELDSSSKGFIKRDQQGTVNKYNYNYWSSPVGPINTTVNNNDYSVAAVFKDGTSSPPLSIDWFSGYDGSQTSPLSLARYWLYKFQNGTQYANWVSLTETDAIKPSQGFTLKGAGAVDPDNLITQNYTFVGKPYNGLININSVLPENLFLVGNPYPSALDAFEFIKDNISIANGGYNTKDIIDGTLYLWEHSPSNATHFLSEYAGGYATLTLVGGVAPVAPVGISGVGTSSKIPYQYIPVGQGFFVRGDANIVIQESVIFNNNQRAFIKEDAFDDVLQPISNTLFKNSSRNGKAKTVDHFTDNSNDIVLNDYNTKIRLGFYSDSNLHRQLLLGFMSENATDGIDVGYDGYQIDTQANDFYFVINANKYSIQAVGAFDINKSIPLGVKVDSIGTVKFKLDAIEFLPDNISILIHDKETATFYDISKNTVKVNLAAGTYNSRFELTFKVTDSIIEEENEELESVLFIYNNDLKNKIFVTKNQDVTITAIWVYNILGQQLISVEKISDLDTIEIPFNVQKGAYIVKIKTNMGVVTKKVLKQ